jgi:hypothetical protein
MDTVREYPSDYQGRKTYVSVAGIDGLCPKYQTYVGGDGRYYLHPDFGGNLDHMVENAPFLMPDKSAYRSPMDNTLVEGRRAHRDHMRKHEVVEAGDLKLGQMTANRESYGRLGAVGADIKRAIQELVSR